jgi:CDP-diacylglycerol--glycerol-3-phosphate 3-phosphatidyltransferase
VGQTQLPTTPNLSTRVRALAANLVDRIGVMLYHWGVHPDLLTLLGLAFVLVGAWFAAQGRFLTAAVILIVGMPLDALDGAVARAMKRTGAFGGVLDSAVDRYGDMIIVLAMAYFFAEGGRKTELLLAFATVVGSTQVSYIRARAGAAGLRCAGGWFSRFERIVVLLLTLLTGWLVPGLAILALGSNLTALQRLWSVYRFAQDVQEESV